MAKLKYFTNLDGLRAVAAFAVIINHFFSRENITGHLLIVKAAQQGSSGVSLFFVLSGFVITRILIATVNEKKYFFNFYAKRCLRIFPLYYFALLAYNYLPYLLNIENSVASFHDRWYFYAYIQNIARTFNWGEKGPVHFWSLAIEEHFYLIWPAIVYFALKFTRKSLIWISFVFIFMSLVLRWIMLKQGLEINVFTLTRIDQLSLGCILATMEANGMLAKFSSKIFLVLMVTGAVMVGLCGTLSYFYLNVFKHDAYGLLYFGLIGFGIVSVKSAYFNRFLNLPFMQFFGRISYGIYVWHMLAILILKHYFVTGNIFIDFLLVCFLTVAISTLSYFLLEIRFLNLKKYLHQKEFSN